MSRQMLPLTQQEFTQLQGAVARLLSTRNTPVIVPGEALLGIEAVAVGVAAPGRRVVNLVSGPYGDQFGLCLQRRGAEVHTVRCAFNEVIDPALVTEAVVRHRPQVLSFVQTETATGGTNPTGALMACAREHGLITVVDSVSAVGAEPVTVDEWGADFVVIGAQKALAGPNGVSAVAVSDRGWSLLEASPTRGSVLSLLDHREAQSEGAPVPPTLPVLEARALLVALALVEQEGLRSVHARHRRASAAVAAALVPLRLEPWQKAANRAPINTTVTLPSGSAVLAGGIVAPGDGSLRGQLLRINHYGAHAELHVIETAIEVLAKGTRQSPADALAALRQTWENHRD